MSYQDLNNEPILPQETFGAVPVNPEIPKTNMVPYLIIFAILFVVMLVVMSWAIDVYYKNHSCQFKPDIWCFDDWSCNTSCQKNGPNTVNPSGLPVSDCYYDVGPTGLASCLYGPESLSAKYCLYPPGTLGATGDKEANEPSCDCPQSLVEAKNCFSGCSTSISELPNNQQQGYCCCSDPNNPACAVTNNGGVLIGTGPCAPIQ